MCRYNGDVECILGHLIPFQLTIIGIVSLSIFAAIIYVAYTIILIKFYKQKRRIRKSNQNVVLFSGENLKCGDEHFMNNSEGVFRDQSLKIRIIRRLSRGGILLPGINHIFKSITAAKYVLTILTTLSLTWMPWVVTMYRDVHVHQQSLILFPTNSTENHLLQDCVHQLLDDSSDVCSDTFKENPLMGEDILYAVHAVHQDRLQMFSIMIANLNPILNPIIYAFWYPEFRKTLILQVHHFCRALRI